MKEALKTRHIGSLIIAGLLFLLANCTSTSMEELLHEYNESDSLANRIPTLSITSPLPGDTVESPLVVQYQSTHWPIEEGITYLQYFVNEENRGAIYNSSEYVISELDTGTQVIRLQLVRESTGPVEVMDEVHVYVKPTEGEKYLLTIDKGVGSGSYEEGARVEIQADAPSAGYQFDQWTGDVQYLDDAFESTTMLTMPAQGLNLTATYKEYLISYTTDIMPILTDNCSACHPTLYEPYFFTCEDFRLNSDWIENRITNPDNPMPPTGLMAQEDIDLILKYIEQGQTCE